MNHEIKMTIKNYIESSIEHVISRKQLYSGIAILMVILYHLMSLDELQTKAIAVFYPGFLGVDIFFLLSGYGLCFSYNKNPLNIFYSRRMKRIVPLFIFLSVVVSTIFVSRGDNLNLLDWFCNLTTLNFWGIGGVDLLNGI